MVATISRLLMDVNTSLDRLPHRVIAKEIAQNKRALTKEEVQYFDPNTIEEILSQRSKLINKDFQSDGYNLLYGTHRTVTLGMPDGQSASLWYTAQQLFKFAQVEAWNDQAEGLKLNEFIPDRSVDPHLPMGRTRIGGYRRASSRQYAQDADLKELGVSDPELLEKRIIPLSEDAVEKVVKSLYILSEIEKQFPAETADGFEVGLDAKDLVITAILFLQVLHQSDVLEDDRFVAIARKMRNVVMEQYPTYEAVKKAYQYSVIDAAAFWVEGELQKRSTRQLETDQSQELSVEREGLFFRSLDTWDSTVRTILDGEEAIRRGTLPQLLRTELTGGSVQAQRRVSPERLASGVQSRKRELQDLKEELRSSKRDIHRTYVTGYLQELMYLEDPRTLETHEVELVVNNLVNSLVGDRAVSSKTKTWVENHQDGGLYNDPYDLQADHLSGEPLLAWTAALKNPEVREKVQNSLARNPREWTLLYRLMTNHVAEKVWAKSEETWVLTRSSHYTDTDIEQARSFFEGILRDYSRQDELADESWLTPRLENLENLVADVFDKEAQKARAQERVQWQTFQKLFFMRWNYNLGISRETRNELLLLVALLGGIFGALYGIGAKIYGSGRQREGASTSPFGLEAKPDLRSFYEFAADSEVTPDSLGREGLSNASTKVFAEILRMPEGFSSDLFFPLVSSLDFQLEHASTVGTLYRKQNGEQVWRNYEHWVTGPYEPDAEWIPDDAVVYRPSQALGVETPPNGYKILGIFSPSEEVIVDGERRHISYSLPERSVFAYSPSTGQPDEVVVVVVPVPESPLTIGKPHYDGITVYAQEQSDQFQEGYWGFYDFDRAMALNEHLSGDPELQQLHRDMVMEYNDLLTSGGSLEEEDEFILRYSEKFYHYVHANRFYSLELQYQEVANSDQTNFLYLHFIASQPDSGYYCNVAAHAFQDFWGSVGVAANTVSGIPAELQRGNFVYKVGHANNVIALKSGGLAYIDTTPPVVPGKTPQEDVEALGVGEVPRSLQEIAEMAGKVGVPVTIAVTAALAIWGIYAQSSELRRMRRYKELLEMGKEDLLLDESEFAFLNTILLHLAQLSYDQPEEFAQEALEVFESIRNFPVEEYNDFRIWVTENTYPEERFSESAVELREDLPRQREQMYKQIAEQWRQGDEELHRVLPVTLHSQMDRYVQGNVSLGGLTKELDAAIDLGILMSHQKMIESFQYVRRNQTDSIQDQEKAKIIFASRHGLLQSIFTAIAKNVPLENRNAAYFAYIHQALTRP